MLIKNWKYFSSNNCWIWCNYLHLETISWRTNNIITPCPKEDTINLITNYFENSKFLYLELESIPGCHFSRKNYHKLYRKINTKKNNQNKKRKTQMFKILYITFESKILLKKRTPVQKLSPSLRLRGISQRRICPKVDGSI